MALAFVLGPKAVPPRLLAAGVAGSILPDIDAIGFWFGVPYQSFLGHRGFTHSISFSVLVACAAAAIARTASIHPVIAFFFVLLSTASHGILDALTNGGLGIALFSPFSNERYFFPWRPLQVSPIGLQGFGGARGATILMSELWYVWLPSLGVGITAFIVRRWRREA